MEVRTGSKQPEGTKISQSYFTRNEMSTLIQANLSAEQSSQQKINPNQITWSKAGVSLLSRIPDYMPNKFTGNMTPTPVECLDEIGDYMTEMEIAPDRKEKVVEKFLDGPPLVWFRAIKFLFNSFVDFSKELLALEYRNSAKRKKSLYPKV